MPNVDNLYGYVANDPIGANDPLGLWKITATGSLNAVAGAMLFLGPGPFGSISGNATITIDMSHPMSSAIGVSYTAAGMGGMGIALDATYSGGMGIDWTNDPIVTGTSSANTAHFEAGIPTSLGTVAAGSLDVNKCGIQAAKVGEGPGVSLYVAGGVAHTGLANMTLQDLVNVIETLPFQMVL